MGRVCKDFSEILVGGDTLPFFESGIEVTLTGKFGGKGYVLYWHIRALQKILSKIDFRGNQILIGSVACFSRKDSRILSSQPLAIRREDSLRKH